MHSAAWKHFCLNRGIEVGFCISGIYGKIYLVKSIQLYYILCTVSVIMFRVFFVVFFSLRHQTLSWLFQLLVPHDRYTSFHVSEAYLCHPVCRYFMYSKTLRADTAHERFHIITLKRETFHNIGPFFNAHLEAPLLNLGFRLLMNNILYCCFFSELLPSVISPCDCVIVCKTK